MSTPASRKRAKEDLAFISSLGTPAVTFSNPRRTTDTERAWAIARASAEFAAIVSVACEEDGHSAEHCPVAQVAIRAAAEDLELAKDGDPL